MHWSKGKWGGVILGSTLGMTKIRSNVMHTGQYAGCTDRPIFGFYWYISIGQNGWFYQPRQVLTKCWYVPHTCKQLAQESTMNLGKPKQSSCSNTSRYVFIRAILCQFSGSGQGTPSDFPEILLKLSLPNMTGVGKLQPAGRMRPAGTWRNSYACIILWNIYYFHKNLILWKYFVSVLTITV